MKHCILLLSLALLTGVSSTPAAASDKKPNPTVLEAPDGTTVVIYRDHYGVPHIRGASETGVFYGQGYAVAQDRLFQLEVFRRAALGRLSEAGLGSAETDQAIRTLFYTEAERRQQFAELPAAIQDMFTSYVAGINAYLEQVRTSPAVLKPVQFFALGFDPADWSETDVIAVMQFFMRRFGQRGGEELQRLAELQALNYDFGAFNALRPINDPAAPTTIPGSATAAPQVTAASRMQAAPAAGPQAARGQVARGQLLQVRPEFLEELEAREQRVQRELTRLGVPPKWGSFAVLIDPAKSATGNAMLLGAPQLRQPELNSQTGGNDVHEVELDAPTLHVSGMTLAGMPGVVIGRNEHHAWSLTSGNSDNIDTFVEILSPEGITGGYFHDGAFRDFQVIPEPDLGQFVHLRTVHGPVFAVDEEGGRAFSWQMTFWKRELEMASAFYRVWKAENLEQFEAAAAAIPMNFNLFYADREQHIRYWHTGLLRRSIQTLVEGGVFVDPRLPRLGDGSQEWEPDPLLDFAALPQATPVAQDYFVNWNNKPAPSWNNGDNVAWADVPDRRDRTFRVLMIEDFVGPTTPFSYEQLKDVPRQIQLRGGAEEIFVQGTYQQAIEFAPLVRDQNIVAPGQSGFISSARVPSPHFADQWALYKQFLFKDMVVNTPLRVWPPNHKYHRVDIAEFVDPAFRETAYITSVWSDEPEDGGEDGATTGDIVVQDCRTVLLRTERAGDGNGRVYTIHVAAPDPVGHTGTAALFQVQVPLGQGTGAVVLDDGPAYEVKSGCQAASGIAMSGLGTPAGQGVPAALALEGNYPNPFEGATEISFALPKGSRVVLSVYNMLGQEVARLVDGHREAGHHQVTFDASGLSAGVYLCRLQAGQAQLIRKMMLVR